MSVHLLSCEAGRGDASSTVDIARAMVMQMEGVAKRFGLTVDRLIDFNADLIGMSDTDFSKMDRVHYWLLQYACV